MLGMRFARSLERRWLDGSFITIETKGKPGGGQYPK
jgi:hypothetical protein